MHNLSLSVQKLLDIACAAGVSDLHIRHDGVWLRRDGVLARCNDGKCGPEVVMALLEGVLREDLQREFAKGREVDFSFEYRYGERFRGNAFRHLGEATVSLRRVSPKIRTLDELGLPSNLRALIQEERGLVLIAGATGAGKTTTATALLDEINRERSGHIITIEDPIEALHSHQRCLVSQREVGRDTHSFADALRAALREDPDVIYVGEMRDVETVRLALLAAETGHLVLSTIHASSAAKAIDRVIDIFPPDQQPQVRALVAETISAVVAQELVRSKKGALVPVVEVLVATPAIRATIREGRGHQLENIMRTSLNLGMQTCEHHLRVLRNQGVVG